MNERDDTIWTTKPRIAATHQKGLSFAQGVRQQEVIQKVGYFGPQGT
jgi:hypothetical protein